MFKHHFGNVFLDGLAVAGHFDETATNGKPRDVAKTLNDVLGHAGVLDDHEQRIDDIENNNVLTFDLVDDKDGDIGTKTGALLLGEHTSTGRVHAQVTRGLGVVKKVTVTVSDPLIVQEGVVAAVMNGALAGGTTFKAPSVSALTLQSDVSPGTLEVNAGFAAVHRGDHSQVVCGYDGAETSNQKRGPSVVNVSASGNVLGLARAEAVNAGTSVRGFVGRASGAQSLLRADGVGAEVVGVVMESGTVAAGDGGGGGQCASARGYVPPGHDGIVRARAEASTAIGSVRGGGLIDVSTAAIASLAVGYVLGGGDITVSSAGSFAHGVSDLGSLTSSALGSMVSGRGAGTGNLTALGEGSHAFGFVEDGSISTGGNGALSCGYASSQGEIIVTNAGASAIGNASALGRLRSEGDGSFVTGCANDSAQLWADTDGGFVFGYATGTNSIIGTDPLILGSTAGGYAGDGGSVFAQGGLAVGRSQGANSSIATEGGGCVALGTAQQAATILAAGIGSISSGSADSSGAIRTRNGAGDTTGNGAFANGFVGNGVIEAYADGARAFGYATIAGRITARGNGATASGYSTNPDSYIEAHQFGSFANGAALGGGSVSTSAFGAVALGVADDTGFIEASASGAFAGGYAVGAGSTLTAGADGATSRGMAQAGGDVNAGGAGTGIGAFAGGYADGANSLITSIAIGAMASGAASSGGVLRAGDRGAVVLGSANGAGSVLSTNVVASSGAFVSGSAESDGKLYASGYGAVVMGRAMAGGIIRTEDAGALVRGDGCTATGFCAGAVSAIESYGQGSYASGYSQSGGLISANNDGSFVHAYVSGPSAAAISSNQGSVILGRVNGVYPVTNSGRGSAMVGNFEGAGPASVSGNNSANLFSSLSVVSQNNVCVVECPSLTTDTMHGNAINPNSVIVEKLRVTGPVGRRDVCPAIVAIDTLAVDPVSLAGTALRDELELAYPNASARLPQGSLVHFSSSDGAHVSKGSWHVIMGRSGAYIIDVSSQIHQFSLP